MTQPYSEDLRERAPARADAGETVRSIAEALRISPSCISKWKNLRRETGGLQPGKMNGHKKGPRPAPMIQPATVTASAHGCPRVLAIWPGSQPAMQNTPIALPSKITRAIQAKISRPDIAEPFTSTPQFTSAEATYLLASLSFARTSSILKVDGFCRCGYSLNDARN
jgi:hypothetical protein